MPNSCAISLRLADVGLLSDAKYASSLVSWSGVTRDRLRLCFTSTVRDEQEMARRRMGFSALSGIVAELGATSDWVGESAVESGDEAVDSGPSTSCTSCTEGRDSGGRSRTDRGGGAALGLSVSLLASFAACMAGGFKERQARVHQTRLTLHTAQRGTLRVQEGHRQGARACWTTSRANLQPASSHSSREKSKRRRERGRE